MLLFQLAFKNLINAGLRTWLNVGILTMVFLIILFYNGLLTGWQQEGIRESIEWEFGHGHITHRDYDPFDVFSISTANDRPPDNFSDDFSLELSQLWEQGALTPILLWTGNLYPGGRMQPVIIKGIKSEQTGLALPTEKLKNSSHDTGAIAGIIGRKMAKSSKLKVGDKVLLRWRDKKGVFDVREVEIVDIFKTAVPTVDSGQIWLSIDQLREMTELSEHTTYWVLNNFPEDIFSDWSSQVGQLVDKGWRFQSQNDLLKPFYDLLEVEKISAFVTYTILMSLVLIAIFDTQVLSVFRRQKEIGTYVVLGLTRLQVVLLFTIEGAVYSILATFFSLVIGTPLFYYVSKTGISYQDTGADQMGIVLGDRIYPAFLWSEMLTFAIIIILLATLVSFLPARKIAKMNPVDSLRGKLT